MGTYEVFSEHHWFGGYEADSEIEAIEACVRDAGYESIADMEKQLDQPCELMARIDPEYAAYRDERDNR